MTLRLADRQTRDPVPLGWLARLARRAAKRLGIRRRGIVAVTFLNSRAMRRVNAQFLRHRGLTDVVCFRYDREPIVGEILVSPACARRYAAAHGLSYRQELARYVIHGLLHWKGHKDETAAQRQTMRMMEDKLLAQCTT